MDEEISQAVDFARVAIMEDDTQNFLFAETVFTLKRYLLKQTNTKT